MKLSFAIQIIDIDSIIRTCLYAELSHSLCGCTLCYNRNTL